MKKGSFDLANAHFIPTEQALAAQPAHTRSFLGFAAKYAAQLLDDILIPIPIELKYLGSILPAGEIIHPQWFTDLIKKSLYWLNHTSLAVLYLFSLKIDKITAIKDFMRLENGMLFFVSKGEFIDG